MHLNPISDYPATVGVVWSKALVDSGKGKTLHVVSM